jgi:UDP-2,4-diacetamido-2,4,6-trideoxy-beta-L-altropyranose hydrolase
MKIVIITDGNNQLGMGHVYQSMTLGFYLKEKIDPFDEIIYITKSNENIQLLLRSSNCVVFHCLNDDLILEKLKEIKPYRVVFDKLDVATDLAKKIKIDLNIKLIICTNLTDANKYADVTVIADFGSEFKNLILKKESGQVQYFGPKYWILRPEFYFYNSIKKKKSPEIKNILLIFGGADPENFSSIALSKLIEIDDELKVTLVLGSAFMQEDDVNKVIKSNLGSKCKVEVLKNINNVAELMFKSDLVLASPGLSFFEALVVGTPVLGFHQNELQREAYANILPTYDKEGLNDLPLMIKNREFIFPADKLILNMEIALGKDEILDAILN